MNGAKNEEVNLNEKVSTNPKVSEVAEEKIDKVIIAIEIENDEVT
jgi:hypothetical protein